MSAAFGAGADANAQDRRTTRKAPEITVQRPSLTSEPSKREGRVSDGSDAAFFAQQMRQREGSGSPRTTTIHKGTIL